MKITERLDLLWEWFLEGLFPRRCPLCGSIALPRKNVWEKGDPASWEGLACAPCHEERQRILEPICHRCGKPLDSSQALFCVDCEEADFSYDRAWALWSYDAQMRRSIQQFKYQGRQEYADYYASQLLDAYGGLIRQLDPDVILPVPIHPSRRRTRGYNQAELLAVGLAQALDVPVLTDYLIRSRATTALKDLGRHARRQSLRSAFAINRRSIGWKYQLQRVLLVDDIYTTGATVDACARVLKEAGSREVYVLCLCVGSM